MRATTLIPSQRLIAPLPSEPRPSPNPTRGGLNRPCWKTTADKKRGDSCTHHPHFVHLKQTQSSILPATAAATSTPKGTRRRVTSPMRRPQDTQTQSAISKKSDCNSASHKNAQPQSRHRHTVRGSEPPRKEFQPFYTSVHTEIS